MQTRYLAFHARMWLRDRVMPLTRGRRMKRMVETLGLRGGERVLDLGGLPGFWAGLDTPLDLTLVNLEDSPELHAPAGPHRVTRVIGDACEVPLGDMSFDVVVSNSVIEHVGDESRQRAMAREVRRLAPRYWVQTPSIWFPIEAHTQLPFWWFYPEPVKRHFIHRWRQSLPAWCEMIEGTRVIRYSALQEMFPDARIWTERVAGLPKSYAAWRV